MLKLLLSLFEYYRILCLYLPNQIPRLWSYNIHVNIKFIDNWNQLKRRNTMLSCKGKLGCLNRNPTIMLISKWKLCLKLWSIRNQKGMNILEQAGIFVASVVSQVLWSQEDYLESPQKLKKKEEWGLKELTNSECPLLVVMFLRHDHRKILYFICRFF